MESKLDTITPGVLNTINCSGLPPDQLTLKVGIPIMLLHNINQSNEFYNGTKIRQVECMSLIRNKFPIISSFVMTINKSQRQTLSMIGLRVLIQNDCCSSTNTTINVVCREVFQNIS
ncbi:hypothetical protein Ahy_A07g032378 [Arachis hypogaea]|uniref:DNA helicase Pif1-like 2B domain-containing protein n=1 Tax=Arachis hypogaea TaxID=3818 RepID=A0A445C6P8_ARAHY|nr:hypothetical protein Ahy_A07g032378 [Arachis hypogaea]